ncbi:MAG: nucleotide excision repair endonuclease [Chitinivibrionales bacterium]|nr:nucleotide excision repair endonuclease [Chitinivibrionales bacterium]
MTDVILKLLLEKPEGATSVELAQAVLKFKNPSATLAHAAIAAILKNDPRFKFHDRQRWRIDRQALAEKKSDLLSLPWAAVGLLRHEQTPLHVSLWSVAPAGECLFSAWLVDPLTLPFDEQQVLLSPSDAPFSAEDRVKSIETFCALLQKNLPLFLDYREQAAVAALCAIVNPLFEDAPFYLLRSLAAAAEVCVPRPLTLTALHETLFTAACENSYAYRRGALLAECCRELLARCAARGIVGMDAFEQELNKGVNRDYFNGKQFTYEQICALPRSFGVYGFKDRAGRFLYIGKSRNLRRRLRAYFTDTEESPQKIERIRAEAIALVTYPCGSELEALLYEYRLIRKHKPLLNAQISILERKGEFAGLQDSIVLLPHVSEGMGMSLWFRANQKIAIKPFATLFSEESPFIPEINDFFFGKKLPAESTDFAEQEIAFRWIKSRYDELVIVEVNRYASAQEVYEAMRSYWKEVPMPAVDRDGVEGII